MDCETVNNTIYIIYMVIGCIIGMNFINKNCDNIYHPVEVPTLCTIGMLIALLWPLYILYKLIYAIYDKIRF